MARTKALPIGALLLLAACATPPTGPAATMMPAMMLPAASATTPMAATTRTPAASQRQASMMPPPPMPPADAVALRSVYGAPDFVRREMDSELWRYDGQGCAAFFFLYREGEVWRLRYSETMPRGRDMPVDAACLSGISLARAARMS